MVTFRIGACCSLLALAAATPAQAEGNRYVRIDSGWSFARPAGFGDDSLAMATCMMNTSSGGCGEKLNHLGSSFVIGVGIGMRVAPDWRVDLSVQRRAGFDLKGSDSAGTDFDPPVTSDAVILSGFYDLPVEWGKFKPFVGLAAGYTRNKLDPIQWRDGAYSGALPGGTHRDRMYQITLGGAYTISKDWSLDLGLRYSDFGEIKKDGGPAVSGDAFTTGTGTGKLRAHEILIGARWAF